MTDFNPSAILDSTVELRGRVLVNRAGCATGFARELHDRLLAKLDRMIIDLQRETERWAELSAAKLRSREDAFEFDLYFIATPFEHRWIDRGAITLLDDIHAEVKAEGETCMVTLDYTTVPDTELEGLAAILTDIRQETGVAFVAARV